MAKGVGFSFPITLTSQANKAIEQVNPTLAAGDVKIGDTAGTALANIATLPVVSPAGSEQVIVTLSNAEANIEPVAVHFKDAAGAEWCSRTVIILPSQFPPVDAAPANITKILGTTLTETVAGYLAAGFKKLLDVVTPVFTLASINQTGDSFARLGAPVLASISADIAAIETTATVAISSTEAALVSTGTLAITAGYTFDDQSITSDSMDDLANATKLWVAGKANNKLTDDQADWFIEKTAGLTRLLGAAYATPAHGTLTVTGSAGAWNIAIHIDSAATLQMFNLDGIRIAGAKYTQAVTGYDLPAWDGSYTATNGIVRAVG